MDWNSKNLTELESIDVLKLNAKQVKFYSAKKSDYLFPELVAFGLGFDC